MVNRLAALNLPADVPAFLRNGAAVDMMEYMGPEPDRWKDKTEDELVAAQSPDHFMDMEWTDLLGTLPRRRYDYLRALEAAQPKHKDLTMTPEKMGLLPYQATEVWERLKVAMRTYRTLAAANQDTAPVESAIVLYAGWLGHYVGDGAQPLHTTIQFNGWTGANPKGFTTEHKVHAQFESGFVTSAVKRDEVDALVKASQPKAIADVWTDFLDYMHRSNGMVEEVYQLEKSGGFNGAGTPEAKQFTEERLAAGATELRDLIYTAWLRSADPVPEYRPASTPAPAAK